MMQYTSLVHVSFSYEVVSWVINSDDVAVVLTWLSAGETMVILAVHVEVFAAGNI